MTADFCAGLAEGSSNKMAHQLCSVVFELLKHGNLQPSQPGTHAHRNQRETISKKGNELFSTASIVARKIEAGHEETLLNSKNSEALK